MSSLVGVEFEPLHAAHAIDNVQFILNFASTISDVDWLAVLAAAREHKGDFPGEELVTSFAVAVAGTVVEGKPGIALRRMAPNGAIEEEFVITRGALVYRTSKYVRWAGCWQRAREIFDSVLKAVPEGVVLSNIGQSVVDKFVHQGTPSRNSPQSVLRKGSPYICSHVFERDDLWHSHTGAFIKHDPYTRRLRNINIDYLDDQISGLTMRTLAISIVVSDQFQQQGYEPITTHIMDTSTLIDEHMQNLHQENKMILSQLLTAEMARRIALTPTP